MAAAPRARMYVAMDDPIRADDLSVKSGGLCWMVGGASDENLARDDVVHASSLDEGTPARAATREAVRRLRDALDGATLPASESDTAGYAVAICSSDPDEGLWADGGRLPNKGLLLQALGLKERVDGCEDLLAEATIKAKDGLTTTGRCDWLGYDGDEDQEGEDVQKAIRASQLMASELERHFELNFSDEIVCAPVLYGGRTGDGDVVAVLSMRVWT